MNVVHRAQTATVVALLASLLAGCAITVPAPTTSPAPPPPAPAPPAAPPPPPPPPPPPAPTSEKVTFVADAFFDFDNATLKPEARAKLDDLIRKTAGVNLEQVIAVGHTDSVGSDAYNQRLSVRRADVVKDYLASAGLEPNRIYTEGKGEKQPVADNKTAESRSKNNRVEIEVVGTRRRDQDMTPSQVQRRSDHIPVFFATNRARTGSDNAFYFYGNALSDEGRATTIKRGVVTIQVPPNRAPGTVRRPSLYSVTLERAMSTPLAHSAGFAKIKAGDPLTDFVYASDIEELTPSVFAAELLSRHQRT